MLLRFLIAGGLWLGQSLQATAAVPLTTARIGTGPSLVKANGRDLTTWGNYGTFRIGAWQERLQLIAGLDLTAYRIQDAPESGLLYDIHGNDVLFFLGYTTGAWNLWGGVGAGQMRIYDRGPPDYDSADYEDDDGEDTRPHRSISQVTEAGVSYDLYRAQYGKIDTSLTWRRLAPEKAWRSAYGLNMIDCLQFEIGFKLLGW
ncbi:MAG TPA: hypothetical protein VE954_42260 [Oligoflexus sp.]|uniref:hypothetical protein n=1 Tax=Oligoflexus sp. TaxID=1971216 RepID=UPI002D4F23D1|nr:hypothetical protein [Oligoflexus sp.]HYX39765.1 hypothetical protein [Oligoflexus sp.]